VFRFTIDEQDLQKIRAFANGYRAAQTDLEIPSAMIRMYGAFAAKNFVQRGQVFGKKWQAVSAYTQQVRVERGQIGTAPPLMAGGKQWLYNTAGVALHNWPRESPGRSFHDSTRYQGKPSDGPTDMFVTAGPTGAVIRMVGAKAAHMMGDSSGAFPGFMQYKTGNRRARGDANRYGAGYLPPRPYWGMNQEVANLIADAASSAFIRNWADRAEKFGSGRVLYATESIASLRWRAL
jgi:hypothetical protein